MTEPIASARIKRSRPKQARASRRPQAAKGSPHRVTLNSARAPILARRHLNRFLGLEPKVLRGDDPEAVHDLRVASRRLQQTLELIYPAPRPAKIRKLRRSIRRSRRALSSVRNYDVLLERAGKALARKRLSRREVWTSFRDYLAERRDSSFRKASRKLGKLHLSTCFVQLKVLLEEASILPASLGAAPLKRPATQSSADAGVFHDRVIAAFREIWSAWEERLLQAQQEQSAPSLHAVRIATKRLRYLIEAMAEMGVPGSKNAVDCLRHLQQHLGNWHDLEVMEQAMLEMVAGPRFLENHLELALETERLVLRNRSAKKKYEQEFFEIVRDSPDWARLQDWCRSMLELEAIPAQQEG